MKRARNNGGAMNGGRKKYRSKFYKPSPKTMHSIKSGKGEMKYFDTERSSTAIPAVATWVGTEFPPNVGTPTTLVCPVTGSGIVNRIGREIVLYKLKIKGTFNVALQINQTAADTSTLIRVALVQDVLTNIAQAQGEDIFEAPTTAEAAMALTSFQSLANFGKFKVWKDRVYRMQNPETSFDGTNLEQGRLDQYWKMNVNFPAGLKIRFNATNGGTIADVIDNSFSIYAMATSNGLAPTIRYNCRACFKEL